MDFIEELKQEVENLIDKGNYSETYDYAFRDGNNAACYHMLSIIDILTKKHPSGNNGRWHENREKINNMLQGKITPLFEQGMKKRLPDYERGYMDAFLEVRSFVNNPDLNE